jgi:UDP-N-acetylmuramate--alanine ligase
LKLTLPQKLHFIGIAGVGMSAIAQLWHQEPGRSTGSDQRLNGTVERLKAHGIEIALGHAAENLPPDTEGVVLSTAVPEDNPERMAAVERGIPLLHRSQVLGELMRRYRSVAVAGTHGKTTTSGMLSTLLIETDRDPTVLVGGDMPILKGNVRLGKSDILVAEADESDKSIRNLWAEVVIITNIEADHLEHYKDEAEIIAVFNAFLDSLPLHTHIIACIDDPGVLKVLSKTDKPVISYGFSPEADFSIKDLELSSNGSTFRVRGERFALQVPGRHNVLNSVAAAAAAFCFNVSLSESSLGLSTFFGVDRRFSLRGVVEGVSIIDDYAHHPSELKATIETALLSQQNVHVVFQPHRHSRLSALFTDFSRCFSTTKSLFILPTYAAGERKVQETAEDLVNAILKQEPSRFVQYVDHAEKLYQSLKQRVKEGDLVLLCGAGDITSMSDPLIRYLQTKES